MSVFILWEGWLPDTRGKGAREGKEKDGARERRREVEREGEARKEEKKESSVKGPGRSCALLPASRSQDGCRLYMQATVVIIFPCFYSEFIPFLICSVFKFHQYTISNRCQV